MKENKIQERTGRLIEILIFFLITGCNYNIQKQIPDPPQEFSFTTGREISYDIVRSDVFEPVCFTCHSANGARGQNKGDVNLETYQNTFSVRDDIQTDIIAGDMPKDSPPLSAYQRRLILAWLDAGANENATGTPNAPPSR